MDSIATDDDLRNKTLQISLALAAGEILTYMPESHVFYYGDNLGVMRAMGADTVDLIYLDPPFNSNRVFNRFMAEIDGSLSEAQLKAFEDYWKWGPEAEHSYWAVVQPGERRWYVPAQFSQTMEMLRACLHESNMLAYLAMMAVRLVEMKRLLKQTGSLYLHCDPTASHYLKVLLDSLFEPDNFRNEIVWKRTGAHGSANRWGDVHDVIFMYTKSSDYLWNKGAQAFGANYLDKKYRFTDDRGRYRLVVLTGSGVTKKGESGKEWGGYDPTAAGRHWAVPKDATDVLRAEGIEIPKGVHARLDLLFKHDMIRFPELPNGERGVPEYKRYKIAKGSPLQDVIVDIPPINSQAEEATSYPTQKPTALLQRIISASSRKGQLVLDPFCGCGTTIVAAQELERNWIGIDITHVAVSVLKERVERLFPGLDFKVYGEPVDIKGVRRLVFNDDGTPKRGGRLEFQAWVVDKIGGIPVSPSKDKHVAKAGGDGGVDGWFLFRDDPKEPRSKRMVISSKSDAAPGPDMIRELIGTMQLNGALGGLLLLLEEPTEKMRAAATAAGTFSSVFAPGERFEKVQILTAAEILAGKRPRVPGQVTSRISQPPAGTPGASEELFNADGTPRKIPKQRPKKATAPPPAPSQPELPAMPKDFQLRPTGTKRRKA